MAAKKKRGKRILAKPRRGHKSRLTFLFVLLAVGAVALFVSFNRPFCANSNSCIKDLSGTYEEAENGVFMGRSVEPVTLSSMEPVLGTTTGDNKRIEVDLTTQTLRAYEGNTLVYTFPVSTGKWGQTPTGEFRIWIKLRYTRMSGGNPAIGTYYNLPNVPYTMYFANAQIPKTRGYGLHGAYWHNNFGHPMSHGCVNMRPEDAGVIYNWASPPSASSVTYASTASPGTRIIISGTAPPQ